MPDPTGRCRGWRVDPCFERSHLDHYARAVLATDICVS
jgi:hypothetical protein